MAVLFISEAALAQWQGPVTIENIETHLTQKNITTIEGFIQSLDKSLRSQYVLMHTSKSLQGASFQKPRVIMFNENAQMMLSFNGDKAQQNGNKIEMILFDKESASFSAHEIDFESPKPLVIKNPKTCLSCHGTDLRPNWNGYSFWEGAYGSHDSKLARPVGYSSIDPTEYREIQKFKKTASDHPRYKFLESLEETTTLENDTIPSQDDHDSVRMKSKSLGNLTESIMEMNNQRFQRVLRKDPRFDSFKFSVLALLSCSMDDFKASLPAEYSLSVKEDYNFGLFAYDLFKIGLVTDAYYLAFMKALNIPTDFLDTSFDISYPALMFQNPGIVGYATSRFSTPTFPREQFAFAFTAGDQDLQKYLNYRNESRKTAEVNCSELSKRSQRELSQMKIKIVVSRTKAVDTIKNVCMTCHQNSEITDFQFSSDTLPVLLKERPELVKTFLERLDASAPLSIRMPLGRILSNEDRSELIEYVESFR